MMDLREENLSDSMEMYLITIARLREGDAPVPLSQLAESLMVTSVSVNEMCRKLQDNGLLIYRPYKGAVLTESGERLANHTLRRHRLWEVFLVEKLHFNKSQADEIACELEHATSEEVIDRLDEYLGFPAFSPRGHPIPKFDSQLSQQPVIALTELMVGRTAEVRHCNVSEGAAGFLKEFGIKAGATLYLVAAGQDNLLVEVAEKQLSLARDLAANIYIIAEPTLGGMGGLGQAVAQIIHHSQKDDDIMEDQTVSVQQMPLSELKKDQRATVVRVGGKGAIRSRMMDMGLVPGSEISVIRVAPFGDPIEYSIKGYSLSLRKSEAENIIVELMD